MAPRRWCAYLQLWCRRWWPNTLWSRGQQPQIAGHKSLARLAQIHGATNRWPEIVGQVGPETGWPRNRNRCQNWPRLAAVGHVPTLQTAANRRKIAASSKHLWLWSGL